MSIHVRIRAAAGDELKVDTWDGGGVTIGIARERGRRADIAIRLSASQLARLIETLRAASEDIELHIAEYRERRLDGALTAVLDREA